jgi:hypothetical protein
MLLESYLVSIEILPDSRMQRRVLINVPRDAAHRWFVLAQKFFQAR